MDWLPCIFGGTCTCMLYLLLNATCTLHAGDTFDLPAAIGVAVLVRG